MTHAEFNTLHPVCKNCQSACEVRETSPVHTGGAVYCTGCGQFQFWLAKDRTEERRPRLKAGTIAQIWAAWGETCAHCGLGSAALIQLGIGRTVQHTPPYKAAGETGQLIPLCDWCQQDSATRMKRLESLLARIMKQLGP